MIKEVLDALEIDQVDLVGNDSGGGISQIFAANHPDRIRSLTLTNCDTHTNWPPVAFMPFIKMVKAGGLPDTLNALLKDKNIWRSQDALGPCYEDPSTVSDETIEIYLRPLVKTPQRTEDIVRFVNSFDSAVTQAIEPLLKTLEAPTMIVWGTDDIYFPVYWATWLAETIPGADEPILLDGARLFFCEEHFGEFNELLREHWCGEEFVAELGEEEEQQ
jgi:pimeloyl-ACP methyl ester carboxylesterase